MHCSCTEEVQREVHIPVQRKVNEGLHATEALRGRETRSGRGLHLQRLNPHLNAIAHGLVFAFLLRAMGAS